uniref:Putative suppressor protein SRP40 n=1 Tax=Davidia involucrata TaxID=16924 RepID=A0A5B6YLE8_DAVIN
MAACGGLQRIFEKPLPNPTLLESFSPWNQIKSMKPIEHSSFTEIFGELHFKETPESSSPLALLSSPSSIYLNSQAGVEKLNNEGNKDSHKKQYLGSHKNSDSFSSMNSESFQLCTEGLGFESSDDVEDLMKDINEDWQNQERTSITKHMQSENLWCEFRRSRTSRRAFPPPISCIGKSGKPCVCFKSYRHDGRFVLKEIRIPTQEFLHAYREGGRLKLHFVQSDDEIFEEEEDEDEENEEDHDSNKKGDDEEKNVEINENELG